MSSAQTRDLITGGNRLQPCKLPTMPPLSPPPHNLKSDIYPFNTPHSKPQSPRYLQHQATTATPTPKDGILRAPRYHDRSCDSLTQKYHVQSGHLVPQSDVSKHGTSVRGGQQNFCLQGGVNSASGPMGLYKSESCHQQKTHWDAGSSKPCGKRTRDPGQGTAAAVVSLRAENTQPNGCQPPGAPPRRPIPLPGRQEGREDISYYGPGLVPGWLMGTVQVDDVPKVLSRLDSMTLPVPFA